VFSFLPYKISCALRSLDHSKIYEIRLRADRPVIVNYGCRSMYLNGRGVSFYKDGAITVSNADIEDMVFNMCKRSVYAYTDKIAKGFITLEGGVRVGLCGECVIENGVILNVKNITSLNVRVPHGVFGCEQKLFSFFNNQIKNTLIISPPGAGKTTLLRALTNAMSEKFATNVLVCDERYEICPLLLADTVDNMIYSPKKYAFENGIRAMSPDVIVTDELCGSEDADAVLRAHYSGVKVIATVHAAGIEDLSEREDIKRLFNVFDLYAVLGEECGKGTLKYVYGRDRNLLYAYDG